MSFDQAMTNYLDTGHPLYAVKARDGETSTKFCFDEMGFADYATRVVMIQALVAKYTEARVRGDGFCEPV